MNDMNGIIPIHYGYCISQARPYGVFNTALPYYIDVHCKHVDGISGRPLVVCLRNVGSYLVDCSHRFHRYSQVILRHHAPDDL